MKEVKFTGTGQLNGCVVINKTIEVDDRTAISLTGLKRNEVTLAILAIHYPGVKINPRQIGYQINSISKPKNKNIIKKSSISANDYKKTKNTFSVASILTFILFFPFKIAWWLLKLVLKKDKY
jgi:hypothetical protein